MNTQIDNDELEQLLQSLDNIPPGKLPLDGSYPFSFQELPSYLDYSAFINGTSINIPYAEKNPADMRIEEVEKQNKAILK
ncbi:uncharacterized protein BDV17DRAFT_290713 [Aspergillus undulatus]|uniref:uncharacterized protein n=1 Tax=Aspergillus undulatus TaxID=1810928 RepID=UPI003CCCFEDA